jgi:hypothetical protein
MAGGDRHIKVQTASRMEGFRRQVIINDRDYNHQNTFSSEIKCVNPVRKLF